MEQFTKIFAEASASVAADYFQLPVQGGDPVYRERVYCYELYAQMRIRWPDGEKYLLDGEIDKQGHPVLGPIGLGYAKPDFLVHLPNTDDNYCIIEVKPIGADGEAIGKDIRKLSDFVTKGGYRRAIYLFFGLGNSERTLRRVQDIYGSIADPGRIEIWLHNAPLEPALCVRNLP